MESKDLETIKLSFDMAKEIRHNIVNELVFGENNLEGAVIVFKNSDIGIEQVYGLKFILNGKDYYFEGKLGHYQDSTQAMFNAFVENLSKQIMIQIINDNKNFLNDLAIKRGR